jgi:AGCS family alanine or glycine:cation symporter
MRQLIVFAATLSLATAALAEDAAPAEDKGALDKADALFGKYFVGPLGSILFFDLVFWDDELSGEDLVGKKLEDGRVVSRVDGSKFFAKSRPEVTSRHHLEIPVDVPAVGTKVALGQVSATIVSNDGRRLGELAGGTVVDVTGTARGALADWSGPAFTLKDGAPVPTEGRVVVQHVAPVPLVGVLDGDKLTLDPALVDIPDGALTVEPGWKVQHRGATLEVTAVDGDKVTLGSETEAEINPELVDRSNPRQIKLVFIVAWLIFGALFLTFRMAFFNIRGFGHAIKVVRGDFDDPEHEGEISHFQALSSALSATVGLGNIAGVAIAVSTGGPGAVFWMIVAGFLGMSSKFTECTLGQMYRVVDDKGIVSGGPMRYLNAGLQEKNLGWLGKPLSIVFALMCIGGSFGGGNMFQANQAAAAMAERFTFVADYKWVFGLIMAILVGAVIIGGIKRIGAAASFLVPAMCGIYLLAGVVVLIANVSHIPTAFGTIISEAFSFKAGFGGFVGVLIVGFQRSAFSNEAGVGSAAIAHSAAATDEPIREGAVALLEPFIDTIIVCTMTGLVVVITGAYQENTGDGVLMTSYAFGSVLSWFPWILSIAVLLFAFSTMISWSYYGERCATLLFGEGASLPYRVIFCCFVFFGAVFKLGNVLDFSDLMILGMAFPNFIGLYIMSGTVKERLDKYWGALQSGQMKSHR